MSAPALEESVPQREKRAANYRKAAQAIVDRDQLFGCIALSWTGLDCKEFCALFDPAPAIKDVLKKPRDQGWCFGIGDTRNELARKERSIALCLMAAIVESP